MKGKVRWWNEVNGYGFITPDDGSGDVFVHWSAVQNSPGNRKLSDGQRVSFELEEGPRGLMASCVTKDAP